MNLLHLILLHLTLVPLPPRTTIMTPPPDGSPSPAQPSATPQASGDQLFFDLDARADLLDIVYDDGSREDYWEQKFPFAFSSDSAVVTFSPNDSSYAIDGTVTGPDRIEVPLSYVGNRAFAVIDNPNVVGVEFTFDIRHVEPRIPDPQGGDGDQTINPLLRTQAVLTIKDPPPDPNEDPVDETSSI